MTYNVIGSKKTVCLLEEEIAGKFNRMDTLQSTEF